MLNVTEMAASTDGPADLDLLSTWLRTPDLAWNTSLFDIHGMHKVSYAFTHDVFTCDRADSHMPSRATLSGNRGRIANPKCRPVSNQPPYFISRINAFPNSANGVIIPGFVSLEARQFNFPFPAILMPANAI